MEQTKTKKLTKKDVVKSFWRWTFFSHSNYNYERLCGTGFCHAMAPIIDKLYGDNPEEHKKAVQRHMAFYNTEPHFGGVINGLIIQMEEERANGADISDDVINGIKTGMMGPFAGVGDTLWQGTLTPVLLALCVPMAAKGNFFGPILYTLLMMGIMLSLAYYVWMKGYNEGREGLMKLLQSSLIKNVITGASAVDAMMMGALTANFVKISTPVVLAAGGSEIALQAAINSFIPQLLPLALVLGVYYLLKVKKVKATKVMALMIAVSAVCALGGIL